MTPMTFPLTILAVLALVPLLARAQSSVYEIAPVPTLDGVPVFYNKVGRVTFGSDGSVRTDAPAPLVDAADVRPPPANTTFVMRLGDMAVRDDGATFASTGNTTIVGEGITYKRLGNTIFGSDGSTFIEMGGTIIGSDGARYVRTGKNLVRTEEAE